MSKFVTTMKSYYQNDLQMILNGELNGKALCKNSALSDV